MTMRALFVLLLGGILLGLTYFGALAVLHR